MIQAISLIQVVLDVWIVWFKFLVVSFVMEYLEIVLIVLMDHIRIQVLMAAYYVIKLQIVLIVNLMLFHAYNVIMDGILIPHSQDA